MERKEIKHRVSQLQDKEALLQLLNNIVKDELSSDHMFSFSIKQLSYYCNPNNLRGRYSHFSIPKKSGGQRSISAPSRGLAHILYYVNVMLKAVYQPSDYAMGFAEGRNVVDNASRHIGQNYVFNTDLENFFPSIEQPRVWKRFQLPPFNFNQQIASVLAGLCCIKEKKENGEFIYVLPQGAPTSPLITNAICDSLDRKLSGLARRFGLHYSRYADDITFSSMHNVYHENGEFISELKRIIESQGFHINNKKTRLQKFGQRQEVTGLTVSNRVNTSREYVAEIRNLLHIWEKYGYNEAYKRFYPHYKKNKGHVKKGEPMLENVLYGKLQYLKMVKGEKDPVYSALQARYNRLTSPLNAEVNQNLDYLRSFTISEFEEIVGSPIQYCLSKDKNLYGKSLLDGKEIIISITGAAKHELAKSKIITDETLLAGVKSVDFNVESKSTPGLYVILTAKNGGSPFWLMTYYDPTVTEISLSSIPATELIDIWEKNGIDSAIQAFEKGTVVEPEKKQNKVKKKTNAKKSSSPIDIVDMGIDDLFIDDIDGYIDEIGYMDDGVDFSFEDM
jgi:retron-type reverse transcriptase